MTPLFRFGWWMVGTQAREEQAFGREEFTCGHAEAAGVPVGHPGGKFPSALWVWTSRRYLDWNYMGHHP